MKLIRLREGDPPPVIEHKLDLLGDDHMAPLRRRLAATWEDVPVAQDSKTMIRRWARIAGVHVTDVQSVYESLTRTGMCYEVGVGRKTKRVLNPTAKAACRVAAVRAIYGKLPSAPKPAGRPTAGSVQ